MQASPCTQPVCPWKVCKKLSELHMIKIEKKTVHRDDEFRDVQEAKLWSVWQKCVHMSRQIRLEKKHKCNLKYLKLLFTTYWNLVLHFILCRLEFAGAQAGRSQGWVQQGGMLLRKKRYAERSSINAGDRTRPYCPVLFDSTDWRLRKQNPLISVHIHEKPIVSPLKINENQPMHLVLFDQSPPLSRSAKSRSLCWVPTASSKAIRLTSSESGRAMSTRRLVRLDGNWWNSWSCLWWRFTL